MGCKGTASLAMVFIMGCREKSLLQHLEDLLPLLFALTLVSAEFFFSHSLDLLF